MNFDQLFLKNANVRKEYALLANLYFYYSSHVFEECINQELEGSHFYDKNCGAWYTHAIDYIVEHQRQPDPTSIPVEMVQKMPEESIMFENPTKLLIQDIKAMYQRRMYVQALSMSSKAMIEGESIDKAYQHIESSFIDESESKTVQNMDLEDIFGVEEDQEGLKTHVDLWDKYQMRFTNGDLYAIGGDTGSGKTTLAVNLAANQLKNGKPVLYVALEETTNEILRKFISILSGYSKQSIKSGKADKQKIKMVYEKIQPLLFILDNTLITTQKLIAWIKMTKEINHYSLVVVDYWQLLGQNDPGDGIREKLIFCADRLKSLAKTCSLPVIVLGQIDKASTKQRGGLGRNDFSDSKQLSNNSSYVIMVEPTDTNVVATIKKSRQPNHNGMVTVLDTDPVTEKITFKG